MCYTDSQCFISSLFLKEHSMNAGSNSYSGEVVIVLYFKNIQFKLYDYRFAVRNSFEDKYVAVLP